MAGPISSRPYEWQNVPWAEGQVLTRGSVSGLPVLTWGRADRAQLATVRQLRELGLRPGGAAPVAVLVFGHTQPYRRPVEHAELYRIAEAVPRRTATPAQRAAIEKALAARRTCERCGQQQDYYLSTVSRQCGPCEDATGFWDDERPAPAPVNGTDDGTPTAEDVNIPVQLSGPRGDVASDAAAGDSSMVVGSGVGLRQVRDAAARDVGAGDVSRPGPAGYVGASDEAPRVAPAAVVDGDPPGRHTNRPTEGDVTSLVAGVRAGDWDALGELYRRYRPVVARYLARRVVCTDDVEDLVQETFLRLPEQADTFDPARYEFEPWLCGRVARWTLIDYGRKERHRHLCAIEAAVDAARRGPVESAESRETRPLSPRVVTALARLTPAQRRSVQLRYLDGLSTHAAAAVAGSTPGAVVQNSMAARRRLRTELADLAPKNLSSLDGMSKIDAAWAAFAAVGRADVPAAQAWLRDHGVRVDGSYLYAIRNGRRGTPANGDEHAAADDRAPRAIAPADVDIALSTGLEPTIRGAARLDHPGLDNGADQAAVDLDDLDDLEGVYPPERAAALQMTRGADLRRADGRAAVNGRSETSPRSRQDEPAGSGEFPIGPGPRSIEHRPAADTLTPAPRGPRPRPPRRGIRSRLGHRSWRTLSTCARPNPRSPSRTPPPLMPLTAAQRTRRSPSTPSTPTRPGPARHRGLGTSRSRRWRRPRPRSTGLGTRWRAWPSPAAPMPEPATRNGSSS